jgi:hypothetical protein
VNREESEQFSIRRYSRVAGVSVDSVEEIVLFVIVRG